MTSASEQLTRALLELASHGRRPRCGDPGAHKYWLSDDADERSLAAAWCVGCPILVACGASAEENREKFGVWAGVDRTLQAGKAGRPRVARGGLRSRQNVA